HLWTIKSGKRSPAYLSYSSNQQDTVGSGAMHGQACFQNTGPMPLFMWLLYFFFFHWPLSVTNSQGMICLVGLG
ncbi:MAG: hypothetical protein U9N19_00480, partial [Thermodesulfobacteriota bacterium]|nr:hypothetical protein [Thermodesulfobacteriota bacterium]